MCQLCNVEIGEMRFRCKHEAVLLSHISIMHVSQITLLRVI